MHFYATFLNVQTILTVNQLSGILSDILSSSYLGSHKGVLE